MTSETTAKHRTTNRRKHATQPTAVDAPLNAIKALVVSLNDLQRQMALAYTPIVQSIIQSGSQDVHEIEHTLDHLFTCAGHPQGLLLFKSLCRYYYGIDPAATAQYVHFYREWYEDAAAVLPAPTFAGGPPLVARAANLKGLGYGG
ncbi:MAG: hypothetical protein Q8J96_06895 [Rhodocyclaceae bacterium]|nr:hypothetical protein [Rhodocyclaceae bacterium]